MVSGFDQQGNDPHLQEGGIDMSEIPNEIFQPLEEQKQQVFKLGTVTNLFENGTAQVRFDGEESPSQEAICIFEYIQAGRG